MSVWEKHRRIDILCETILIALIALLGVGAVSAYTQVSPAQEFLNGQFTEDIKALSARVEHIETMVNYVLTAIMGTLIVQALQIRMHLARRVQDTVSKIVEP